MNPGILASFGQKRRDGHIGTTTDSDTGLTTRPPRDARMSGRLKDEARCPMCGSENIEQHDGKFKCVDCGIKFVKADVDMDKVFQRVFKAQRKTFDKLAGVNYTDKQVED